MSGHKDLTSTRTGGADWAAVSVTSGNWELRPSGPTAGGGAPNAKGAATNTASTEI